LCNVKCSEFALSRIEQFFLHGRAARRVSFWPWAFSASRGIEQGVIRSTWLPSATVLYFCLLIYGRQQWANYATAIFLIAGYEAGRRIPPNRFAGERHFYGEGKGWKWPLKLKKPIGGPRAV